MGKYYRILLVLTCVTARGDTLVLPPDAAFADGNLQASIFNNTRFQQAYSAGLFTANASQSLEISEIRFRVDPNAPPFASTPELEIRLSTMLQNPDTLNSLFSANVGANEVVALPRSTISWSGNPGLSFDVVIPLPNHFVYSPSDGNLLLDVSVFNRGPSSTSFDGVSKNFDGISTLLGGIGSPSGSPDTFGFVSEFTFTSVPEPRVLSLLLLTGVLNLSQRRKTCRC